MTKLEDLVVSLDKDIESNAFLCKLIKSTRKKISDYRKIYLTDKTTGAMLGVIGGVGLILAPFNVGLALLLSLAACAVGSVIGIGLNIFTDIVDYKETNKFIKQLNGLGFRNGDPEKLTKMMDQLTGIIQGHVDQGMSPENATGSALVEFGGYFGFCGCPRMPISPARDKLFGAPKMLTVAVYGTIRIVYACSQSAKMDLSGGLADQGLNVANETLNWVAVAAGVAFIAIDMGLLLKDFTEDNEATGAANKIEEQIEEQTKTLTQFRNELELFSVNLQLELAKRRRKEVVFQLNKRSTMTKLEELLGILDTCIQSNDNLCQKIRKKRTEISDYRDKYLLAKVTGTTLGVFGGVGLILAPFTAGTSLLLCLWGGAAGTLIGGGVNIVTDIIDSKETKEFIDDLNRFIELKTEDPKKLTKLMDELTGIIQRHKDQGMSIEKATGLALAEFGGYGCHLMSVGPACGEFKLMEAPGSLTMAVYGTMGIVYMFAKSAKIKLSGGLKVLGLAGKRLHYAKESLKGFGIAHFGVFVAIDVGMLIKDLTTDHQATGAAIKIEEQIQEQTKTLTKFRNELKVFSATSQLEMAKRQQLNSTSSDDDGCICQRINLTVLYCNMQSANPFQKNHTKLLNIKHIIQTRRPNIVALVETWLTSKHQDWNVIHALGLEEYEVYRYDRCDNDEPFAGAGSDPTRENERKGGGCLVAWLKTGIPSIPPLSGSARHRIPTFEDLTGRYINFSPEQFPTRTYSSNDNLRSFSISCSFNCGRCNQGRQLFSHSFRLVYRRPKPYRQAGYKEKQDKEDFDLLDRELIEQMCDYYDKHVGGIPRGNYLGGVVVGDFNWSDGMSAKVQGHIQKAGLVNIPIPGRTINKGQKENPDMVFDFNGIVEQPIENLGFVSDHSALIFNLKLGSDYDYEIPCPKCIQ